MTEEEVFNIFADVVSEDLMPESEKKKLGDTYLTFDGLLDHPGVQIFEDAGRQGCGSIVWPAGENLSRYMIHKGLNGAKNVLELGSGTGLVGLAMGLHEKQKKEKAGEPALTEKDLKIWVTDQEPMFELMKKNVVLNGLQGVVEAAILDWGDELPSYAKYSPESKIDLVLAADCVYLEAAFPLLETTLLDLTENDKGLEIYMSYKKRRKADSKFFKHMKKNFLFEEIKDYPDYAKYNRQAVYLYKIIRKK